jgi:hypothetical protein
MLRVDPQLLTISRANPMPNRAVPPAANRVRFPAAPAAFVAREPELERVTASLRIGRPTVVHGLVGVGKTALALQAGHRLFAEYPDGMVFVDLRGSAADGPRAPAEALHDAAAKLSLPASNVAGSGQTTGAVGWPLQFSGRRILVVLDDVAAAEPLRALGMHPPGCAVVMTSRSALGTLDGVKQVLVGVLTPDEALRMLRAYLGAERVDQEPAAARRLTRQCEYLPLALRIAAARLAARPHWSIESFAQRLAVVPARLDVLIYGSLSLRDQSATGIRLLARFHDRLALRALHRLAELDLSTVTVPTLADLLGVPETTAESTAEHIVDAGLAQALPEGLYHVPEFVRAVALEAGRPADSDQVIAHAAEQPENETFPGAVQAHPQCVPSSASS